MADRRRPRPNYNEHLESMSALLGTQTGPKQRAATAVAFGRRVTERRVAAGMSQAALAARTGLSQAGVSHVESGRRVPSIETARVIAHHLDVSVASLMGERRAPLSGPEAKFLELLRAASPEIQAEVTRFLEFRLGDGRAPPSSRR